MNINQCFNANNMFLPFQKTIKRVNYCKYDINLTLICLNDVFLRKFNIILIDYK